MIQRHKIMLLIRLKPGYPQRILAGIRKYAIGFNHWLWQGASPDTKAIKLIKDWKPDGIIGTIRSSRMARELEALRIPTVDVGGFIEQSESVTVGPDNVQLGKMAAEYFLGKNFTNFAYIGTGNALFSRQRQQGFLATLQRAGYSCQSLLINAFHDFSSSRHQPVEWTGEMPVVKRWLNSKFRRQYPLAIFCSHDEYALAVLSICNDLGISVPDEVAVLGTDDNELVCALANPPLSSIRYNAERIGYEAAKVLHTMLTSGQPSRETITVAPANIVVRQSSERLIFYDADVAAAVRVVQAHAGGRLRVADVVNAVCISRRSLEIKFKKSRGHGIYQEILKSRVDLATKLIKESDLPLKTIALRAGFTDRNRMLRAFRAVTGMAPALFRRHRECAA